MKIGYDRYDQVINTEKDRKSFMQQSRMYKLADYDELNRISIVPKNAMSAKLILAHFAFYYKTEKGVRIAIVCNGAIAFWGWCDRETYDKYPVGCQNILRNQFIDNAEE